MTLYSVVKGTMILPVVRETILCEGMLEMTPLMEREEPTRLFMIILRLGLSLTWMKLNPLVMMVVLPMKLSSQIIL